MFLSGLRIDLAQLTPFKVNLRAVEKYLGKLYPQVDLLLVPVVRFKNGFECF